jgi:hypothetical protein
MDFEARLKSGRRGGPTAGSWVMSKPTTWVQPDPDFFKIFNFDLIWLFLITFICYIFLKLIMCHMIIEDCKISVIKMDMIIMALS